VRCKTAAQRFGRERSAVAMAAAVVEFPKDMRIGIDRIHEVEGHLSTPVSVIMTTTLDELRLIEGRRPDFDEGYFLDTVISIDDFGRGGQWSYSDPSTKTLDGEGRIAEVRTAEHW